jgi:predicted ArsR family transcriptional regulator
MKQHQRILNYCQEYWNRHKKFPLLSEVAEQFNISSEAVRQQFNRLVSKGYLVKSGRKWRGYTLKVRDIVPKEKGFIRKMISKIKGR